MKRQNTSSSQNNWEREWPPVITIIISLPFPHHLLMLQAPSQCRRLEKQPRLPSPSLLRASLSAPEGRHHASRSFESYMDRFHPSHTNYDKMLTLLQKQGASLFTAAPDIGPTDSTSCLGMPLSRPPASHKSPATASGVK